MNICVPWVILLSLIGILHGLHREKRDIVDSPRLQEILRKMDRRRHTKSRKEYGLKRSEQLHEFKVLGKRGETNAAHDYKRSDLKPDIHIDDKEAKIEEREFQCNEYYRQIRIAIRRGRDIIDVPKPENITCDEMQDSKRRQRNKRYANLGSDIWTNGIVPYMFDSKTIKNRKAELSRIRAHNHYQYWTCIRFVPHTATTRQEYGLDHDNYLRHTANGGCNSKGGNRRVNGQNINCCSNDICVHELGHAFGLGHEQRNPLIDDYVSVNYYNIDSKFQSQYYESNKHLSKTFGYYDLSNVMHYGIYGFSTGGKTMTIFDPDLEYLVQRTDPYQFYLFSEVSQTHDCKGLKCDQFTLKCHNGGYQAFVRDMCTCRCPEGLDSSSGCTTRYDGDRTTSSAWPSSSFTLLSVQNVGCPDGFYKGQLRQHHESTKLSQSSSSVHAEIQLSSKATMYHFCTKRQTSENGISPAWPAGKYCIYRKGGSCPDGFVDGVIRYDDISAPDKIEGSIPDGDFSQDSSFQFCCRSDGSHKVPIFLPDDTPFILFPQSKNCQQVNGMTANLEYFRIRNVRNGLYERTGDTPKLAVSFKRNYALYYCYYTPHGFEESSLMSYSKWPRSSFSTLEAATGCPTGFQRGSLVEHTQFADIPIETFSSLRSSPGILQYHFCTKHQTNSAGLDKRWQKGQYCILRAGGTCPEGFTEGRVQLPDLQSPTRFEGVIPDAAVESNLSLQFCCREDGFARNPLTLPNKEPFILFRKVSKCQHILDMSYEEEVFRVGTRGQKLMTEGDIPHISQKRYEIFVHFCYYYPSQYDCGEVIHLTDEKSTVGITSPQYPNQYPPGKTCFWNIIAPKDYKLMITVNDFDVIANTDGTCDDWLEIRHSLPGQFGLSYCGDRFPGSIITETNQLGLTFQSSLLNFGRGFSSTISIVKPKDPSFCYTKKGEDYRGKLDVTRHFTKCLPWSQTKHCQHNAYNQIDLDDDLVGNYCRNPGRGTRPWCYTDTYVCTRDYCDVCQIEKCYDVFNDCADRTLDRSNCEKDPEMKRGCRKSCNFCDHKEVPGVGSVSCNPPQIPRDALHVELKSSYSVGDTVQFTCRSNEFEIQNTTCLADGTWSNAGFVCGRCKSGWTPYKNECYKLFEAEVDRRTAQENCLAENNGYLASSKDKEQNDFLNSLVDDGIFYWIGLIDGNWEDGDPVIWENYHSASHKDCAYMSDKHGKWIGVACAAAKFISFVCAYRPSDRVICTDASLNCDSYLRADARACENRDFRWHTCPKSCGFCNAIPDRCQLPDPPDNSELMTQPPFSIGSVLQYSCKSGFSFAGGNLARLCQRDSSFSGSPPVCKRSNTVSEAMNNVPITPMRVKLPPRKASTGFNEMMRIKKLGRVVKWMFYSETNGIISLQIWRRTLEANTFQLIGQNVIEETYVERVRTVEVPVQEQIDVRIGDLIAVFPVTAEIPYDRCDIAVESVNYGNSMISERKSSTSDWVPGNKYTFGSVERKENCRIIPVNAYVQ